MTISVIIIFTKYKYDGSGGLVLLLNPQYYFQDMLSYQINITNHKQLVDTWWMYFNK